jgi:hypothetical protein
MPLRINGEELVFRPVGIRTSHDSAGPYAQPARPAEPPLGASGAPLLSGAVPQALEEAFDADELAEELLADGGVYYPKGLNIARLREGGGS